MSSSSGSEDEVKVPMKRMKRRHHPVANVDAAKMQKVNLYSHKILPKLDALAKSPVKLNDDDDEGNECVPFDISDPGSEEDKVLSTPPKKIGESSIIVSGSDSSPSKIIPPTPPPPFRSTRKRGGRGKANKLLQEVSTVLKQVSHDSSLNESVILCDEEKVVKEIMVKIRLKGKLQKFPLAESNPFSEVFEKLADRAKVDLRRLLVTFGDRRVFPSDTPIGIQMSIADILECVIAHTRLAPDVKDMVRIQMQGPFRKKKMKFTMGKTEVFLEVMKEYAEQCKVKLENLQFQFDGEIFTQTQTPMALEMDNDDCIDVLQIKKK